MVADELLEAALTYAGMGFAVFPCKPGDKAPACEHGLLDATTDEDQIERWWSENPTANVAIATAGLLVVDIDGKNNPWLSDLGERAMDLAGCPAAFTPRGGMHIYFRQPEGKGWRNTTSSIGEKVDTRSDGGYVVAPPSNLAGGGGYRWLPEREIEQFLPEPPEWLQALLDKPARKRDRSERQEEPTAKPNPIPEGKRNSTLASLAGHMRRIGMGPGPIAAALHATNCDRCSPPLDPREVEQIASSIAKYNPDENATNAVEGFSDFDTVSPAEPFPNDLLWPPGFLSRVMEYNLAGAYRAQPILALAGSIALLSTLTGRKVQDDAGTRTNLYILGVAASGSGKERARVVNKELLFKAGGKELIGPESPASSSGITAALVVQPSLLFQWDEIGRLLATIGGKFAGPHLANVSTVLMKLFTSSGSVYFGDAYADSKRNQAIDQPHAVLYGTTVPKNLYENLSSDSINDGFMSRLLIFESEDASPDYLTPDIVDDGELVGLVKEWLEMRTGGNLSGEHPQPTVFRTTDDAAAIWREMQVECLERERDKANDYASLWTRAIEKARKLALLHTCSRGATEIDGDAAQWGRGLSIYLTNKLASVGRLWVAGSQHEANCKRVLRWLQDRGGCASKRDLSRHPMQSLKKQDREAVLEHLAEMGAIYFDVLTTKGRPSEVVRLANQKLLSYADSAKEEPTCG